MTEIRTPISTDHFPVLFSHSTSKKSTNRGKGFWKFNTSVTKDQNNITEIETLIRNFRTKNESLFNRKLKLERLEYESRNFTIWHTKHVAKEKREQRTELENRLKKFGRNVNEDDN